MNRSALLALVAFSTMARSAVAADEAPETQFTLRPEVYDRLSKAQTALNENRYQAAIEEVERIQKRIRLNPHEQAMVLQTLGYIYAGQEKLGLAAKTLEECHALGALPAATQTGLLYSIGQLHLAAKNYERAVVAFDAWVAEVPNPRPDALYGIAAANYQSKKYQRAIHFGERAVKATRKPKDSWLQLLLSSYVLTKRYRPAADILTQLIERHPERESNWLQLVAMYAQLGDEARALAVMELAHRAGLLNKPDEIVQLAQRMMSESIPEGAARLLEHAIANGKVPRTRETTRLLAAAWLQARSMDKAAPAMATAAKLADDGELYARLAQIQLEAERYSEAIRAGNQALAKGGLKNAGQVHLLIGIAEFRVGHKDRARKAFAQAATFPASKGPAEGWIRFLSQSSK